MVASGVDNDTGIPYVYSVSPSLVSDTFVRLAPSFSSPTVAAGAPAIVAVAVASAAVVPSVSVASTESLRLALLLLSALFL